MSGLPGKKKFIRLDSVRTPDPTKLVFSFTSNLPFFKKNEFLVEYSESIPDFNEAIASVIFAAVMAPVAQASGAELLLSCLDEEFAQSLDKISAHWHEVHGWKPLKLLTKGVKSSRPVSGCGMLFSGGIDSMASFIQNRDRHPRLFVVIGADVPYSKTTFIERLKKDFYGAFAKQEKAPLTYIHTDIRAVVDEKALSKRFMIGWYGDISYGLFLTSLTAPMTGTKEILLASCSLTHPNGGCGGDPDLMGDVIFGGTAVHIDLLQVPRVEKIKQLLAPNPRTHRFLRVCWQQYEKLNCSRCNKCLRTICELLVNNIDPNEANFEMTASTLAELKTRMTTSFYHFFYSESDLVFFRQTQEAVRLDKLKDMHGSKDFFKWFQDFQEIRLERSGWIRKARYLGESLRQKFERRSEKGPRKAFFIIGGYTYANPGDEAILKTTVFRLNRLHPKSHFIICSDKEEFSIRFSPDISSEYFFYRCHKLFYKFRLLQWFYRLLFPLSSEILRSLARDSSARIVDKMSRCDHVLFIGGGYLNSLYNLLQMHFLYRLAKESGRPVYLLGQTLGPFTRLKDRKIAGEIFRGAEKIILREESSLADVGKYAEKAIVGGDDALAFQDCILPEDETAIRGYFEKTDKDQVVLGLNLRPAGMPPSFYAKLIEDLNRFNTESARGKLKVVFVPMETSAYCDDRSEAEILEKIEGRNFDFSVINRALTVENRLAAISKTDLFVGMRFHSLVFSLASGVPCLGLYLSDYYHRKNEGLLEMYDMRRYCLRIEPSPELAPLLTEMFRDRAQLRATLNEKHAVILKKQTELYTKLFAT